MITLTVMNHSYEQIEIDTLVQIYREREHVLITGLVSGTSWDEVKEDRNELTNLAAAILSRYFPNQPFLRETFKYQIKEEIVLEAATVRSSLNPKKLILKWAYLLIAFPLALLLFLALRFVFYVSILTKMMKRLGKYNRHNVVIHRDQI